MRKVLSVLLLVLFLQACTSVALEKVTLTLTIGDETQTVEIVKNGYLSQEFMPTQEGFVFKGWYLDATYLYPYALNVPVVMNDTLYAKFEPVNQSSLLYDQLVLDLQTALFNEHLDDALLSHVTSYIDGLALLEDLNILSRFETQITSLVATSQQAVVMIDTYRNNTLESGGSGVIYKRVNNRYYVVTNEHVTEGYQTGNFQITLFLPSGELVIPRQVVTLRGESRQHDLAVLTFESTQDLPVMAFADETKLKQGQLVFAIGSPLDLPNTVSMGIISYKDREQYDEYLDTITIQHTASINPGNSGGALINILGELVGINFQSYVDEYVGEGIEGLHFAIQIDILKSMLPLLEH